MIITLFTISIAFVIGRWYHRYMSEHICKTTSNNIDNQGKKNEKEKKDRTINEVHRVIKKIRHEYPIDNISTHENANAKYLG